MRIIRILSAAIFAAVFGSICAFAQGTRPATPAPTPAAIVPAPTAKVGLLDVSQFYEDPGGITRLVAARQQVAREFKPREDRIRALQAEITKLENDLRTMANSQGVVDPTKVQQLQDQLEQKKKELQREGEDYQAASTRRWDVVREPIEQEIGRAIADFATKRGITLVLNVSQLAQGVIWAAPGADITAEFIKEYNAKPPAAAATTPARP